MRWSHLMIGLLGAAMLFAAAILAVSGTSTAAAIGFVVVGGLLLVAMTALARDTERVVVVGPGPQHRLEEELDDAGFVTLHCPGPGEQGCPVHDGLPCPYESRWTVGAVIRVADGDRSIPPCEAGIHGPAVAVETDPVAAPHPGRVHGRVATSAGPKAAVSDLRHTLETH